MEQNNQSGLLPGFKPFYDEETTKRFLTAYYNSPHLYNEQLINQLKDHAAHYNIPFEEEQVRQPRETEFNLLRGVRQLGEGFFSGFTTFNVGEATNNPYERIMRSVGQVAGFVGYVPSAPFKIMQSANLVKAAQALRGNSVPLIISKKATEMASPIAREVLEKAAKGRSGATSDVAKFLTGDKAKHIAEGAFNLGVANTVGAWQLGVNEMLKQGLHGAVTGGAFRGIAELVNKGGIPKIDPLTGKSVLTTTQKEDKIIRAAASSLYDGMQSTLRGETTPEQIYSYLLGAYFGANETTAGQMKVFGHIKNTEKMAAKEAKATKRINPATGEPYNYDTSVYDPAKVEGWDKLTDSEKDSVYQYMLSNHGTYGKQAMMTDRLIQETQLEPGDQITAEQAYKGDIALKLANQEIEQQQIADKAAEIGKRIDFEENITDDAVKERTDKKGKVFIVNRDVDKYGETAEEAGLDKHSYPLYIDGMQDADLTKNKAIIKGLFDQLEKADEEGLKVIADKDFGKELEENAPETYKYLTERILKLEAPYEKAASLLEQQDLINLTYTDDKVAKDDSDIGMLSQVEIERKTKKFVNTYLKDTYKDLTDEGQRALKITAVRDELGAVLKKHLKRPKNKEGITVESDKFIKDVEKTFKVKSFTNEARQELRQLLMRQNQTKPLYELQMVFRGNDGRAEKNKSGGYEPVIIGREGVDKDGEKVISRLNQANEDVLKYDSIKAIDIAAENLGITDNVRMEMSNIIMMQRSKSTGKDHARMIPMSDINKKKNYWGDARWDQDLADKNAIRVQSEAMNAALLDGYYYHGSKGDSGRMIFLKWHPESQAKGYDFKALRTDYFEGIVSRSLKDPVTDKEYTVKELEAHYNEMRKQFINDHEQSGAFHKTGSIKNSGDYFDKSFASNMLWEKELYGLNEANMGGDSFAKWIGKNSSIKDAKGFNKRNQIWMTDGYEMDSKFFVKDLSKRVKNVRGFRKITDKMKLRYRLIRDSELDNLTNFDEAELFTEATDGMILVEENVLDAMNESFGLPSSGQNKAFIVDKDPTYGAFLGKMMFHKASPAASKHMREAGIEMYVYDSAAKEKGSRDFGKLSVTEDLAGLPFVQYTTGKDNVPYYEMNLNAIKGSLSEKQTSHMMEPQLLPKQMMANLVSHAKSPLKRGIIEKFFNETIGQHHLGDPEMNKQFDEAIKKDSGELTETEQNAFLNNIDKIGLSNLIDAIKTPKHSDFVAKLYKKILNKNLETLHSDYASGEIEAGEYQIAHAEASSMNRGIDRMVELSPSLEVFLYRDVRNYLQEAMKSFVVTRVIRPRWDHSLSVRMRGLDPWLAIEKGNTDNTVGRVRDLNLKSNAANKKYLKKTYGVDNADELFFLDNRYMKTKWNIGDFLTGGKENREMTLLEIWQEYGPFGKTPKPEIKDFFKTISLRVPMDSISGAHQLTFAGFTGIDGHGAVFHPRTMKALGGADLDGDKAFVFFGMKPEFRELYHSNKYEFSPTGDETGVTADNKTNPISAKGIEILKETLEGKEDPYSMSIMERLSDPNFKQLTLQDLLTTTTAGDANERTLGASPVGKYTVNSRLNIGAKAVGGRSHLGPAVSSKQILNGMYDALMHTPEQSEALVYRDNDGNDVEITIKPRKDLDYSRELQRAQIAFGSDPLDELGLVGIDNFFNLSWNSMFKVDFGDATPEQIAAFEPTKVRQGLYKIFKDFNSAYFSKNYTLGRRWRAAEIQEMANAIDKLEPGQLNTMLPQMVKILQPLDYTDDIISRIDIKKLETAYKEYHDNVIPTLSKLNEYIDDDGKPVQGGLLGRGSSILDKDGNLKVTPGFTSQISPITNTVILHKLYSAKERNRLLTDYVKDEKDGIEYLEIERLFDSMPADVKGRFNKNLEGVKFKHRLNPRRYKDEIMNQKVDNLDIVGDKLGKFGENIYDNDTFKGIPAQEAALKIQTAMDKIKAKYLGEPIKIKATDKEGNDFTYKAKLHDVKLNQILDGVMSKYNLINFVVKTRKGKEVQLSYHDVKPEKPVTKKAISDNMRRVNQMKYNNLMGERKAFRKQVLDQIYRDGTEFMQFDAMDRASGISLIYALQRAKDNNVPPALIHAMARQVQHIKEIDRKGRNREALAEVQQKDDYDNLTEAEKKETLNIITMDDDMKGFSRQEKLNDRIKQYKFFNAFKKKLDPNQDSNYPGMLNATESYLFDTMMMSSYYRGKGFQKIDAFNNASPAVQKLVRPYINATKDDNSGTFFRTLGLDSPFIKNQPIQDFLARYSGQLSNARNNRSFEYNIEDIFKKPETVKVGITEVPKTLWEEDYVGVGRLREKAVAELNDAEVKLVDELAGHINHYRSSFKEDGTSLNKLVRGILSKNVDAMTTQDYRTLNNFFRQLRSGNMFVNPGKITKDGIVKLSQRHYMLFPKTVDEELMIKEFEIFEQRGMFQNYNGEWREGKVGRPMQIIEHIQYVNGTMQDLAVKMVEDESNEFNKRLSEITGYETLENGLGMPFFEVATALRDFKAAKNRTYENRGQRHAAMENAINNLREAYDKAGWKDIKDDKKFNIVVGSKKGKDGKQRGGNAQRTKWEIVNSIDEVLTHGAIEAMQWIKGDHMMWDGKNWIEKADGNPLDMLYERNSISGEIMYHHANKAVPKIDLKKFSEFVFEHMKEGKPMNMKLGIDNLRIINRNLKINQLYREGRRSIYDNKQREAIFKMIRSFERNAVRETETLHPTEYHPHIIENKASAVEFVKKQVNDLNESYKNDLITEDQFKAQQADLVTRYKTLTGQWYIDDVVDADMFDAALNAVAERRLTDPIIEQLTGSPVTGNMMERSAHLAGWARDIGAWETYRKNLIDAYFRQVAQVTSQHMLQKFHDYTAVKWKDRDQADAWADYIQDYITRSLGNPSRIPKSWLEGDKANLMNVRGTPYAWWADNRVAAKLSSIKKKLGIGQDERLPEELRGVDEMDIRHWSNMEAKFQMATLLAHPKSSMANIFGGTMHTIQSVGWRNWRNARNINWLKTNLAGSEAIHWKTMKDVSRWAISHGVVPDFVLHEAGLSPFFRKGKYKGFLDEVAKKLKKDPTVKDETLMEIAKKHKISDSLFNKAAWFMREPERMLRQDAFVAHYLAARERYGHANMELDHPFLIAEAKKGVKATQFLYSAPYRPAFSTTSLGKAMTRFQTWAWNSVRFRKEVYRAAAMYDFRRGTPEFERFKRQFVTDQFVFALGNVFAYSLFESAMPQPYSWFQDTADWLFGDEKERDRAFFGQWPTAVAPLQMVTPPGLRLVPATFNAVANNDFSRISEYQMWTMFPFGRLARDVKGIIENPMRTIEKTTGLPYMQFATEATKYRLTDEEDDKDTEELLDEK